jgi:hypothetical protein
MPFVTAVALRLTAPPNVTWRAQATLEKSVAGILDWMCTNLLQNGYC